MIVAEGCLFCGLSIDVLWTADVATMLESEREPAPQVRPLDAAWALADLAPIATGHVLVTPSMHVLSTAALETTRRRHLHDLAHRLGRQLSKLSAGLGYVMFEHGTAVAREEMEQPTKCGPTEHAHIHVLPKYHDVDVTSRLREHAEALGASLQVVHHVDDLDKLLSGSEAYHYLADQTGSGGTAIAYSPAASESPSQLFRRFLIDVGVGDGPPPDYLRDWRNASPLGGSAHAARLSNSLRLFNDALTAISHDDDAR